MTRLRSESGQVIPFVGIVLSAILLGVCALAIDVGVWFKASRHAQTVADAAALAGAQDLPNSPSAAVVDAQGYAQLNGGALDATPVVTGDTITVQTSETAPAYFARIFGMGSQTLHATATAQGVGVCTVSGSGFSSDGTGRPLPLVVSADLVRSTPLNQPVALAYGPADAVAGGQFGLLDLDNTSGGTSPGTLGGWIANNYQGNVSCGSIQGVTGNKFNSPQVFNPLSQAAATHKVVLLPVYTGTNGASGGQMSYIIGGFAAFQPTSFSADGSSSTLQGSFVHLEVDGQSSTGAYFGVGHLRLTK